MGIGVQPCCCLDCTIFSDNFDRTTIGGNWNVGAETWTCSTTDGGQLTTTNSNASINTTVGSGGIASVDVSGTGQLQILMVGYDSVVGAELDTDGGTFSMIQNQFASPATLVFGSSTMAGGSPSVHIAGSPYVWTVAVSGSPTSGTYSILFTPPTQYEDGAATATINWNDNGANVASKLQTAIQTLTGLGAATVSAAADTGTSPNLTHTLTVSGVDFPEVDRTVLRQCDSDETDGTIAICVDTYPDWATGGEYSLFTASLNGTDLLTWANAASGVCGGTAMLMTGIISGTATFENLSLTYSSCGKTDCPAGARCCWPINADGTLPAEMQVVIAGAYYDSLNGTYLLPQSYPLIQANLDSDESGLTGGTTPGIATNPELFISPGVLVFWITWCWPATGASEGWRSAGSRPPFPHAAIAA